MPILPARLERPMRPFRAVAANRDLRLIALAYVGFTVSQYGVFVALLVVAYEAVGTTATGLVGLSQLVLAAVVAPFAALLTGRRSRSRRSDSRRVRSAPRSSWRSPGRGGH